MTFENQFNILIIQMLMVFLKTKVTST